MAEHVAEYLMSAEDYLEWESAQSFRHELIDNRIYPMPGGSPSHESIITALVSFFFVTLYDRLGAVYGGGMKTVVDAHSTYTYPDVCVVIGEPRFRGGPTSSLLENPTLLFEVLSPSTRHIDRNRKRERYLQMPSLRAYFLVAQDQPMIEAYTRTDGEWQYSARSGLDASLHIPALGIALPLREVYHRVDFAAR